MSLTCNVQKRMFLVDGRCALSTMGNNADSFFWYERWFVSKGRFVPEQVSGYDITSGASPRHQPEHQSRAGVGAQQTTGSVECCRVELDQQHLNKEDRLWGAHGKIENSSVRGHKKWGSDTDTRVTWPGGNYVDEDRSTEDLSEDVCWMRLAKWS